MDPFIQIIVSKRSGKLGMRKGYAKRMRSTPTPTEWLLWEAIRKKRLAPVLFKRQFVLGPYIVDFYCASARLVIEVDGRSHIGKEAYDARRDRYLAACNLHVLHVTADAVLYDLPAVLSAVQSALSRVKEK